MYQFSSINFKKCDNYGHSFKFVKEVYDNFFAPLYILILETDMSPILSSSN